MNESILSIKLKEYRIANSITQQELAEMLDVSDKSISKWELGKTYPRKNNIIKIAELLNVSIELLLLEEVVDDKQKGNKITKYLIPLLMTGILIMSLFNFFNLKIMKDQNIEITKQKVQLEKQQLELDTLYNYTVTFVLVPKTPYTDFEESLRKDFDAKNLHVLNGDSLDYIIISFTILAHNNKEMEFIFQEIKEGAPGVSNSEYHLFM